MTSYVRIAVLLPVPMLWALLYLLLRFGKIDPGRLLPWLRFGFVSLIGVSLLLFVFGQEQLSNVLFVYGFGLKLAEDFIRRRTPKEDQPVSIFGKP